MPGTKSSGRPGGNPDIKKHGFKSDRDEPLRSRLQIRISDRMKQLILQQINWQEFVRKAISEKIVNEQKQETCDRRTILSKEPIELRRCLQPIAKSSQYLAENSWEIDKNISSSLKSIPVRGSKESKSVSQNTVADIIRLLQPDRDELLRCQAAAVLGEIGANNRDAINALIKLLHSAKEEETYLQASLSLRKLEPENSLAAVKISKLIDLGAQLEDISVYLIVVIMPKVDEKNSVLLQVKPHSEEFLPFDLKLNLLSKTGETKKEIETRSDSLGRGIDKRIELLFSPPLGTHFCIRLTRGNISVNEDFIA